MQVRINDIIKAFWLMVAWPPSGPATVVILVVDYISELTIHSLYVHPFYVLEMYNTLFIVNLMQQVVHNWYKRIWGGGRRSAHVPHFLENKCDFILLIYDLQS